MIEEAWKKKAERYRTQLEALTKDASALAQSSSILLAHTSDTNEILANARLLVKSEIKQVNTRLRHLNQ